MASTQAAADKQDRSTRSLPADADKQPLLRNTRFSKTKLCRFELLGICAKGLQCPFAHGSTELKAPPDLRYTKLCKQLLSQGQCTTPNCTYAHSKDELRNVSSSKEGSRQKGGKADPKAKPKQRATAKEQPREVGSQLSQGKAKKAAEQSVPLSLQPPPGLDTWGGEEKQVNTAATAALFAALMEQQQAEAKDRYADALSAVLRALPTQLDLAKAKAEELPLDGPAYVPLRLGFNDESPFTESTAEGSASEAMTEVNNLAEEVATTALEDGFGEEVEGYHMDSFGLGASSFSDYTGFDVNEASSYGKMHGQFSAAEQAWGWNPTEGLPYPGMSDMHVRTVESI
eukprot:TRINITY_DN20630_c0_g1_i1.p1 TRINITY_DN20630_c0_g1~~TRINITY_DN20630_c0_g1_i1.p1  ORF type:complete len:343 (-),score=97.74 TRINITY_DN20630_c0_g1_i1:44-1072(-)